ncbi:hypothetical protein [Marinomonas aquiplantarum]|uniref:Acetyltransferase (GNAT) family protein n=1 Tax=Marinomonas aquiplantarum TaxID=491951 RepID=A0A366D6S5_9GAMM|nr:hypothetical protein [Marinomonas aquiplantarum]RBO85740.1 hypothetical protein DFP76_10114 [Marinomonas aquiplantarum]
MAETYSYRPYKLGDERAINELYFQITGNRRTADQFAWQWLEAPEGRGDMWLIEATNDKGEVKLIGHHGVMPIAFSNGNADLLFGKTENTMVLPEYRNKILYPRFEKKFIKAYQARYDALFSTMGPPAAIRQRKAMGYEFPVKWYSARHSTKGFFTELIFSGSILKNKIFKASDIGLDAKNKLIKNGFLSEDDAIKKTFFDDFWDQARLNFSTSPRRSKADLSWRFWNNPYKDHFTYVINEGRIKGYCIISLRKTMRREVFLEDFCVHSNLEKDAKVLFYKLINALKESGFYSVLILCAEDSALYQYGFINNGCMLTEKLYRCFRKKQSKIMPRKINDGMESALDILGWDVTGIVLEGRA